MKIAHVVSDGPSEFNSTAHRGMIPTNYINRFTENQATLVHIDSWMKDNNRLALSDADLIIVERVLVEESIDRVRYWRERGKAVVIDIDDSYQRLQSYEESGNQAAKFWRDGLVDITYGGTVSFQHKLPVSPLEQFRQALVYCTGMTMPSRFLASEWEPYARCWYVPNYIDAARFLPHKPKLPHRKDELVIGWGGSMSHKISFERSGLAPALRRLFQKRSHLKFMLCGDDRILNILKLREGFQDFIRQFINRRKAFSATIKQGSFTNNCF